MKKSWKPYPRYIFRKEISISLIKKYLDIKSNFLEIGCASGDLGVTLAKMGYKGLMIDFSEEASKEVNRRLKIERLDNISFDSIDFFKSNKQSKFDFIIMFEVLEHVEKDRDFLRKAKSFLKEGGFLILSVPARMKYWGASDIFAGHIKRYEKKELINLLKDSGFKIVKFISYGFPWLNFIRVFRDKIASKKIKNNKKDKTSLTKNSGLNAITTNMPFFELFSNKYILYIPIKISNFFNNFDIAEGYICLVQKK